MQVDRAFLEALRAFADGSRDSILGISRAPGAQLLMAEIDRLLAAEEEKA